MYFLKPFFEIKICSLIFYLFQYQYQYQLKYFFINKWQMKIKILFSVRLTN
jgi:hypothetical protein